LEEKVADPVQKAEINGRGESVALTTRHPLSAKVRTTSPTSGGCSVGIDRSRTKATEFIFFNTLKWLACDNDLFASFNVGIHVCFDCPIFSLTTLFKLYW
jgi:hypothetical protein